MVNIYSAFSFYKKKEDLMQYEKLKKKKKNQKRGGKQYNLLLQRQKSNNHKDEQELSLPSNSIINNHSKREGTHRLRSFRDLQARLLISKEMNYMFTLISNIIFLQEIKHKDPTY